MTRSRFDVVPAIQWHEGMLLSSHHLQQSDLRFHQIISQRLKYILPFNYGVASCAKDEVAFAQGVLRLTDLSGVMEDGEILDYSISDEEAQEVSLDLNPLKDQLDKPTYIWCGLPQWISTRSPLDRLNPRFRVVAGIDVPDNQDQTSILTIPRLLPILTLHAGNMPPADFVSMPLFKVMYDNGQFISSPFEPPCFCLDSSGIIFKKMTEIAVQVRHHVMRLTEKYKQQRGTLASIETYNMLADLRFALPILDHMVDKDPDHPYDIYLFINSIIGNFSMMDLNRDVPPFPTYNHNDLLECLMPRFEYLQRCLEGVDTFYNLIPFQQKDLVFYYEPFMAQEEFYVGIKFPNHVPMAQRLEWAKNAIIIDGSQLDHAILTRTTGYARTIVGAENYPTGLYNYSDILMRIEPGQEHDLKLIIFNPMDEIRPMPTDIYFAQN